MTLGHPCRLSLPTHCLPACTLIGMRVFFSHPAISNEPLLQIAGCYFFYAKLFNNNAGIFAFCSQRRRMVLGVSFCIFYGGREQLKYFLHTREATVKVFKGTVSWDGLGLFWPSPKKDGPVIAYLIFAMLNVKELAAWCLLNPLRQFSLQLCTIFKSFQPKASDCRLLTKSSKTLLTNTINGQFT